MQSDISILRIGTHITRRGFLVSAILFTIFYMAYFVFSVYLVGHVVPFPEDRLFIQALFNLGIAVTMLATSFFVHKLNILHTIYISSIANSIVAVLLFFISDYIFRLSFIFAMAIFFGTGLLAFYAYFWNLTAPEERGRIGGALGFFSLFSYLVVTALTAINLGFSGTIFLGIILSLGTLSVILLKPEKLMLSTNKFNRKSYHEKKTVLLYTVPWVLFSLSNSTLAKNISFNISQQIQPSFYLSLTVLQIFAAIFGTLAGGIIADFFGRRLSLTFSLTLYGISSVLAGLANNSVLLYVVYVANGLSWGFLLTLYTFVVWGDLSNKENYAKMYSIGLMIFYAAQGIGLLSLNEILMIPLAVSSLASCLLIFLSNVPLILASELLPSDFRERIRLRLHMNALRKIGKQSQDQG